MKSNKLIRPIFIVLLLCLSCLLGACSRLSDIELPPLPTPSNGEATPGPEFFLPVSPATPSVPPLDFPPPASPTPELTPEPIPTPEPTPELTPEPENPNIPHLYIENATYPENMTRYSSVNLYGDIYTDKGVIAQVCGRIYNNDTDLNEQICLYYPYQSSFSLAGTVNAKLVFGVLEPGHYTYIVTAIAEYNSYTNGEEVLIEHGFEIYYE